VQEHAFCLQEILHLRMALESFTTAALEICCVWCVTKEVAVPLRREVAGGGVPEHAPPATGSGLWLALKGTLPLLIDRYA